MKPKFVISPKNFPTKLPVHGTAFYIFLLHYFNANGIWWGAVCTILALLWIQVIINRVKEVEIDLTDNEPTETKEATKSKFQIKLEEMAKQRGLGNN